MIDGPSAGVVISGNNAVGVFQVDGGVTATLADLTISGGSATGGGGIDNGGTLLVSNCTIANNSAGYSGAGIYNSGSVTVSESTVSGNAVTNTNGYGGGIFSSGTLTVTECTISGNSVGGILGGYGGGIFNSGTATVTGTTIVDNLCGAGGGIENFGTLTAINSTIASNSTGANGGGIVNGGTLTAVDTTVAYNDGGFNYYGGTGIGGGVYDFAGATTTLYNTIVAANTADDGPDDIGGFGVSSASVYDLAGIDETGSLTHGTNGNLVIGTANPGLGLLAYNGGPTQTIVLRPGSPAIDAGSNALADGYSLTTDQRGAGFPRIVDATVDIGAYEQAAPSSTTLASSPNPSVYGQTITLTATVTAGNPATVYTVNSTGSCASGTGTSGTLPYVIGQANLNPNLAGSVIQFAPTIFSASNPQTITLTNTLDLGGPSGPLVIDGPGAAR